MDKNTTEPHFIKTLIILLVTITILAPQNTFADARKDRFRSKEKASQYVALGGRYSSDYNSKEYKISGAYEYTGSRFIHELDFLSETQYSSTTTTPPEKDQELYDLELSSKILIWKSNNYFNYYNRSKYDDLSDYYYDVTNAVGWGRMFFGGMFEADINVGYNEIKNFDSQIILNPNLRANFDITDKIRFTTKAYLFKVKGDYYEELKSRIAYKMTRELSLELYHNYRKKRFFDDNANSTEVQRNLIFRVKYNF
jgi:hypothetical protein